MKSQTISIDFDGTMVRHVYPQVGKPCDNAVETIHRLMESGHKIILYTMRGTDSKDGVDRLQHAIDYMLENEIDLYGVNVNPTQKYWTNSPKCYSQLVIDDISLGIPLVTDEPGRDYVDWYAVEELLEELGYFEGEI